MQGTEPEDGPGEEYHRVSWLVQEMFFTATHDAHVVRVFRVFLIGWSTREPSALPSNVFSSTTF